MMEKWWNHCEHSLLLVSITLALQELKLSPGGAAQIRTRLAQSVSGQEDWTQFLEGRFENTETGLRFRPVKGLSRLQTMATTEGLLAIPEGTAQLLAETLVQVQLLPGFQLAGGDSGTF